MSIMLRSIPRVIAKSMGADMGRLNDTEALVKGGIRDEDFEAAPQNASSGIGLGKPCSAERATSGRNSGHFRKETNAGVESLAHAVEVLR